MTLPRRGMTVASMLVALLAGALAPGGTVAQISLKALMHEEDVFLKADLQRGEQLYAPCAACHGPRAQGNHILGAPNLTGQNPEYLRRQLGYFKQGVRGNEDLYAQQMMAAGAALPDASALRDVAAYIANLPPARPARTLGGRAASGKAGYTSCALCHGQRAEGISSIGFPSLSMLDDWYLQRQLTSFQEGKRGKHRDDQTGAIMRASAGSLHGGRQQLDVVAYIVNLDQGKAP